jgi:hypothetical protein
MVAGRSIALGPVVERVRVDVAPLLVGVTELEVSWQVGPSDTVGETEQVTVAAVLKPSSEVNVMVAVAELPGETELGDGAVAAILKSCTAWATAFEVLPLKLEFPA